MESVFQTFCISMLYFLLFSHQYINAEHENALLDNSPQPVFDFLDEQGDVVAEPFVSRHHLELRSVNSDSSNLKLAAFNVQTFGTKKMATRGVPEILVKVSINGASRLNAGRIKQRCSCCAVNI